MWKQDGLSEAAVYSVRQIPPGFFVCTFDKYFEQSFLVCFRFMQSLFCVLWKSQNFHIIFKVLSMYDNVERKNQVNMCIILLIIFQLVSHSSFSFFLYTFIHLFQAVTVLFDVSISHKLSEPKLSIIGQTFLLTFCIINIDVKKKYQRIVAVNYLNYTCRWSTSNNIDLFWLKIM